eukprot:Colp12_sorted_trinity150504_noHs@7386
MPPKQQPSKKNQDKQKAKVIEDKTFGLKNKKGKKQQTFVKQVEAQVKHGNQSARKLAEIEAAKKKAKEETLGRYRKEPLWLVLGVPKRWRQMPLSSCASPWLCA